MNTARIGDIGEIAIAGDLLKRGFQIAFPYGTSWDYDLLASSDGGRTLLKFQVKTTTSDTEVLTVRCRTHSNTSKKQVSRNYSPLDFDYLAVYDQREQNIYYIPSSMMGRSVLTLRLQPTKNGQESGVHYAVNYVNI